MNQLRELFNDDNFRLQAFSIILIIASNIFAATALYCDCRLTNIKFTLLFTVICAIFGLPALAIYFIVRKRLKQEVPTICTSCGKKVKKDTRECPKCGNKHFAPRIIENRSEIKQKVLICLVISAVLFGARYYVVNYSPLAQSIERQEEAEYSDSVFEDGDDAEIEEDVFE